MSLRDIIGPYVRLAGCDNLTHARLLQQSSSDSARDAIVLLEKLTGFYDQVADEDQDFKESKKKLRAFDNAAREVVFVGSPAKSGEAEAKRQQIARLHRESEQLLREEDERLLKDDDMVTGHNAALRTQIRGLQNQQEDIRAQLAFLSTSHEAGHAPTEADW